MRISASTLNEDGLAGVLACITELLKQTPPGSDCHRQFPGSPDLRSATRRRSGASCTSWRRSCPCCRSPPSGSVSTTAPTPATTPEFAVADAIMSLGTDREADRDRRVLSVLKLRGSGSLSGNHAYRLSSAGLDVFPRMADPVDLDRYGGAPRTHVLWRRGVGCHALRRLLPRRFDPAGRTFRHRQDAARAPLHLRRRAARRDRADRNVPGEPDPAGADPQRVLVVAGRSGHRAHVPQPSRSVSRRMGLRPARHRAPHRRHQSRHRQPGRPASRLPETKFASASTSTRCCSAAPAPTSASS